MRRDYGPLGFDYLQVRDQDPSIDKRFKSNRGEFCSFMVKKGRLTKDPIILLKRFLGKLSAGKGEQSVLGYFHLWAFNYNQGDYLVDIFDEEELQAHNILTTIMFNLKKEGIRQKPDWTLLKIDGSVPEEVDALAIFSGVKETIIDRIENEAQFIYNVPAGLQEFQVVYENIQSMLVPEYGE